MSAVFDQTGVAVIIPAYRVTRHVLQVIAAVGVECERIYVVDDACPDRSGELVESQCSDPRVRVLFNSRNLGVGGAVMSGYRQAIADGMRVLVKLDGDGQMDPSLIGRLIGPINAGEADYCKGNRFYDLRAIGSMPPVRRMGNLVLSFMAKASTGYWDVFDPNNGFTAIHAAVAARLPFKGISERYFFETDMLFRLNTLRAVVVDMPMDAVYGDERSNLKVSRIVPEFFAKHVRNLAKRVAYNYFLRDLSIASFELVVGLGLTLWGVAYGSWHWYLSWATQTPASTGTVMLPALALIAGLQLILAFLGYDIASVPRRPMHSRLHMLREAP